eukprot:TRINITY_DN9084_c0_g1_i1.p1 TRINITY_DN9084_c0_g1~~TRINITY_DN9084_c0_g1_i1.p1  ORF type:complete len:145 (-),score=28.99 TRINITY_DN9084_c0_g1_i1:55-489(-)
MSLPFAEIVRKETFSACHRLHNHDLSDEENRALFGKCNNPNGHGHNYTLKVAVRGPIDPISGMVMNLVDLKAVLADVLSRLDHKHLDLDVEDFKKKFKVSTTENLAVYIWDSISQHPKMPPNILYQVLINETDKNSVVYRGGRE